MNVNKVRQFCFVLFPGHGYYCTRSENRLLSNWYSKPADTELTMNYRALALSKYERSVIAGLTHRINRAGNTCSNFHTLVHKNKVKLF